MAPRTFPCALALALALGGGGCATTWATSQLAGTPRIWDEQVHEEVVPLPGVEERLTVALPLGPEYPPAPASTTATPAPAPTPLPFALTCTAEQRAQDAVYHAAFRYGRQWKKGTAIMFLVEGLAASAFLLLGDGGARDTIYGGFFAVDAAVTGALFFAPRKDIYRRDLKPVATPIRSDCPEAMTLTIGGDVFAVDAAGRIGEVGEAALDAWMQAPAGAVRVGYAGQAVDLPLGVAEQCTWSRHRQRPAAPGCAYGAALQFATTALTVPAGTLTRAN